MKKLIAMIGAVAMGFGLFANAGTTPVAMSFETDEAGISGTPPNVVFTLADADGWSLTGTDTTIPVAQYADGEVLPYESDGAKARRDDSFTGGGKNENYLKLSTGNEMLTREAGNGYFVLDQLVKFTGFEDPQTNLVEGAKIAVWMSGVEADKDEGIKGETNLYVTCAKVNVSQDEAEPIAIKIAGDYKLDTWYRLTIRTLNGGIYAEESEHKRAGFILYVNGEPVAAHEDDEKVAKNLIPEDFQSEMTKEAKIYLKAARLFPALIKDDVAFNSVSYKGIGGIDDVIIDDVGPDFAQTADSWTFTVTPIPGLSLFKVEADDLEGPDEFGKYKVPNGTEVTITWALKSGYKVMSGSLTQKVTVSQEMDIKPTKNDVVVEEIVANVVNAATPSTTNDFAASELYAMISELGDGDTATFLKSVTIWNGDNQLYEFSNGDTTIGVSVEDGVTTWEIQSAAEEDWIADYVGAPSNFIKNYIFADGESSLTLGGQIAGEVKAANIDDVSGAILSGGGKVVSQTADLEISIDEGELGVLKDTPEESWYTYYVQKVDNVTFTVTYNPEDVTNVKVNGEPVEIDESVEIGENENVSYEVTVPSNAVVQITADIVPDNLEEIVVLRNGVKLKLNEENEKFEFPADADGDVITIEATSPAPIALPEEPIDGVKELVVSQSVDGVEWTKVDVGNEGIHAYNKYIVIAIPSEGYRADNPITNGVAESNIDIDVSPDQVQKKITKIHYVAQIVVDETTTNKYETLKAAVEAAVGGDTIEVIANCEVPETICFYNTGTNAADQITLKNDHHVELTTFGPGGKNPNNYSFYIVNANVKVTGTGEFSKTNGSASAFVVGSMEKAGDNGRPATLGWGVLDFEGNLTGGIEAVKGSNAPSGMIKVEAGFCNFVGGSVINWRNDVSSGKYNGKCVSATSKEYKDAEDNVTNKFVGVVTIQAGTFKANEPLLAENDGELHIIGKDNTAKVRPLNDTRELDYAKFCEPGYTFLKVTEGEDAGWYKIGMKTFSIVVLGEGCYGTANPSEFTVETNFPLTATLEKPTAPDGKKFDSWSANFGEIEGETLTINEFPNENVIVTVVWKDILVTSVTLDIASTNVAPNETFQLIATVLPEGAADKTIVWTTSDEGVATVEEGVVTAVAEGTATITATNAASGKFATCTVTVQKAVEVFTITYMEGNKEITGLEPTTYTTETAVTLPTDLGAQFGGEFKGWYDNAGLTGEAVTEIPAGSTGNKTFWAKIEEVTGEPAKVINNDVEGQIPEEKKDQAVANAKALVNAKGDAAGVSTWVKTVYGEGGKIPAEKLANASAENVALAVEFDVPLMEEPTISAPVVAEKTTGPAAFEFVIKDGATEVEIKTLTDNVKKIVKYAAALGGTNTFGPVEDKVTIGLNGGKIKAEFVAGPAAGFMKADFNKAE